MTQNNANKLSTSEGATVKLKTHQAMNLFQGRQKTAQKNGILGLPGFVTYVGQFSEAIKKDDPYADHIFYQIDQELESLKFDLELELKGIETLIAESIPEEMTLPETAVTNQQVLPIRFVSKLGFLALYQLIAADRIFTKILLANHLGILTSNDKFAAMHRIARRFRRMYHLVYKYQNTGVTRDDMAANNQKAQAAIKAMGKLEPEYLSGEKRSEHAPRLPERRLATIKTDVLNLDSVLDAVIEEADAS